MNNLTLAFPFLKKLKLKFCATKQSKNKGDTAGEEEEELLKE